MKANLLLATVMTGIVLVGCTAKVESTTPAAVFTGVGGGSPIDSGAGTVVLPCADYSGAYTLEPGASMNLKQTACESMEVKLACDGPYCSFMGIENTSFTLPLNNSMVSVSESSGMAMYQAQFVSGALVVTRTLGNKISTKSMTLSDHPCDPANPGAGIEMQATESETSEDGTIATTSCLPWGK